METCDKCGPSVKAAVVVMTPVGPITFCNHCNTQYNQVWQERGYLVTLIASPASVSV